MNDRFKLDNNMLLLLDPWYIWVTRPQSSEGCGLKIWSSFSPTSQVTISVSELQGIMESPFRVAIGCTSNLWSNYWQLPLWLGLCGYKYCHQGHFLGLVSLILTSQIPSTHIISFPPQPPLSCVELPSFEDYFIMESIAVKTPSIGWRAAQGPQTISFLPHMNHFNLRR